MNSKRKEYLKEYRIKNKEQIKQKQKEYFAKNKERIKAKKKNKYKNITKCITATGQVFNLNENRVLEIKNKDEWLSEEEFMKENNLKYN